jgi:hypothetical protein
MYAVTCEWSDMMKHAIFKLTFLRNWFKKKPSYTYSQTCCAIDINERPFINAFNFAAIKGLFVPIIPKTSGCVRTFSLHTAHPVLSM